MAGWAPYGGYRPIRFPLITFGASDFDATPLTFATGDVQISQDGGAFANCTNLPTHLGNGIYSLVLTAAETSAGYFVVTIIDQTSPKAWEDQSVDVETYGNVNALHSFDLGQTTPAVNVTQLGGIVQSLTDLKDFADAGYDPATNKVQGVVLADTVTDVTNRVTANTDQVEGVDATDQIRDAIVDDATRIDASLLNTHSAITAASIINALKTSTAWTAGGSDSYQDIVKAVYAMARGKFTKSGSDYTFYDDDGTTALFTLTIGTADRTTA